MASPASSMVTSCAEHGMLSPDGVLNTRQSGRKSIMRLLQFFDFLHEVGGFFETAVDACVTDKGHGIDPPQAVHHARTDFTVGNFSVKLVRKVFDNLFDEIRDGLLADGAFLAGFLNARPEFLAQEFLCATVALEHHEFW